MTEHHLNGMKRTAYGTGKHTHHRAWVERDGHRIGYWACAIAGGGPCPDEPMHEPPPPPPPPVLVAPPPRQGTCLRDGHVRKTRTGGTTYCATCHAERERLRVRTARAAAKDAA